jgi:hypothetical protein
MVVLLTVVLMGMAIERAVAVVRGVFVVGLMVVGVPTRTPMAVPTRTPTVMPDVVPGAVPAVTVRPAAASGPAQPACWSA